MCDIAKATYFRAYTHCTQPRIAQCVRIATRQSLDGLAFSYTNPSWEFLEPSHPHQPPLKCVPETFPWVKSACAWLWPATFFYSRDLSEYSYKPNSLLCLHVTFRSDLYLYIHQSYDIFYVEDFYMLLSQFERYGSVTWMNMQVWKLNVLLNFNLDLWRQILAPLLNRCDNGYFMFHATFLSLLNEKCLMNYTSVYKRYQKLLYREHF